VAFASLDGTPQSAFFNKLFTFNALLFTAFSFKVITVLKNLPFFLESL